MAYEKPVSRARNGGPWRVAGDGPGGGESREAEIKMWVFVKMGCEEKIGEEEGWHIKMEIWKVERN